MLSTEIGGGDNSPPERDEGDFEKEAPFLSKEEEEMEEEEEKEEKEESQCSLLRCCGWSRRPKTQQDRIRHKGSAMKPVKVEPSWGFSTSGLYKHAAVTSTSDICSRVGVDIMHTQGGSAVDSAIATMLCIGVVNQQHSGIGGGGIMTIYGVPHGEQEKVMTTITYRERAPAAAYPEMYVNQTEAAAKGGLAIAIPGEIMGFYEAWKKFGRLEWKELFQPAIRLCKDGHPASRILVETITDFETDVRDSPSLRERFVKDNGELYEVGDILTLPQLADTLEKIASDPLSFYNGTLASDVAADIRDLGGIITDEDLASYISKEKFPLKVDLHNGQFSVYAPGTPSSGVIFQLILNILDGYNFTSESIKDDQSKQLTYHRIIEAFKFAFAKRSYLGDDDFIDVSSHIAQFLSRSYAEKIRSKISDGTTHDVWYYEPAFAGPDNHGTTHVSVLGPDGSAVSMTNTINFHFGAMVIGKRTGILFNNEMADFSVPGTTDLLLIPAYPSNFIQPGKMPMSSMSPVIILNQQGRVVLNIGAAGGPTILSSMALVTAENLWFGKSLLDAIDEPRFHHQLVPNILYCEYHMDQSLQESLKARGHTIQHKYPHLGDFQAMLQAISYHQCSCHEDTCSEEACIEAVGDARHYGSPDGF